MRTRLLDPDPAARRAAASRTGLAWGTVVALELVLLAVFFRTRSVGLLLIPFLPVSGACLGHYASWLWTGYWSGSTRLHRRFRIAAACIDPLPALFGLVSEARLRELQCLQVRFVAERRQVHWSNGPRLRLALRQWLRAVSEMPSNAFRLMLQLLALLAGALLVLAGLR